MSDLKSQLQHGDPLADARVWLAHMEKTLARLAAEHALEKEKDGPRGTIAPTPPKAQDKALS